MLHVRESTGAARRWVTRTGHNGWAGCAAQPRNERLVTLRPGCVNLRASSPLRASCASFLSIPCDANGAAFSPTRVVPLAVPGSCPLSPLASPPSTVEEQVVRQILPRPAFAWLGGLRVIERELASVPAAASWRTAHGPFWHYCEQPLAITSDYQNGPPLTHLRICCSGCHSPLQCTPCVGSSGATAGS